MGKTGTGPYCITSGCIPRSTLNGIETIHPAGEGTAYFIPENLLPQFRHIIIMARSDVEIGHRTEVLVRLGEPDRARLLASVFRPGSRSVMFRFPAAGEHDDGDMFGAIIEELDEQPDGLLRAHLLFWNDLARSYATPGAEFEVWYARTVGGGVVLS